ncbi:MAG: hypothetical protein Q9191_002539 [Dirinaria sp. TL-2023a]
MSRIGLLGDPLIQTQHLIGASKWQKVHDNFAIGHHQLRAAHQRYADPDRNHVQTKGYGYAFVQHFYSRIEGVWKLAGLKVTTVKQAVMRPVNSKFCAGGGSDLEDDMFRSEPGVFTLRRSDCYHDRKRRGL